MRSLFLSTHLFILASVLLSFSFFPVAAQQVDTAARVPCENRAGGLPSIGQLCGDVIYAGTIDGAQLYVEAQSRVDKLAWEAAAATCAERGATWRLPTEAELRLLFESRNSGSLADALDAGWYWSSSPVTGLRTPWIWNLTTGHRGTGSAGNLLGAICVRSI